MQQAVSEGNVEKVSYLLREAEEEARAAKDQLCHPLCYCKQCTALEDRYTTLHSVCVCVWLYTVCVCLGVLFRP